MSDNDQHTGSSIALQAHSHKHSLPPRNEGSWCAFRTVVPLGGLLRGRARRTRASPPARPVARWLTCTGSAGNGAFGAGLARGSCGTGALGGGAEPPAGLPNAGKGLLGCADGPAHRWGLAQHEIHNMSSHIQVSSADDQMMACKCEALLQPPAAPFLCTDAGKATSCRCLFQPEWSTVKSLGRMNKALAQCCTRGLYVLKESTATKLNDTGWQEFCSPLLERPRTCRRWCDWDH